MARFLYGEQGARMRRLIYGVSAILVIFLVLVYILNRRSVSTAETSTQEKDEVAVETAQIAQTNVDKSVAAAPLTEPSASPTSGQEPTALPVLSQVPAVSMSNPQAGALIAEAMTMLSTQPAKIIEARDRLNETLPMSLSAEQRAFVKQKLSELADKWLFTRTVFPQDALCGTYEVSPGDLLSTIGRRYKVPYEILMEINNIAKPELLQAGQTIKVINGPFHARVNRSTFIMDLYLQNTYVRSFSVGLGQPGMETPTGLWVVKADGKLIQPTWTDPISGKTYQAEDPDYPLGSRWIGLEGVGGLAQGRTGFAIHGTKSPEQIGTAGSQGCIRLHNGDAILVYNLLTPTYSQVEIVE
jgi:LysM repeat protein